MEMTVESLSQILEEELENAVEVKDRKSLHRWILILTENIVSREKHTESYTLLQSDLKEITSAMKAGFESMDKRLEDLQIQMDRRFEAVDKRFEAVDKRFETVDKRFEDMQIQMDRRFTSVDRRFSMMFAFLTIGFTILAVLMSLYNFF